MESSSYCIPLNGCPTLEIIDLFHLPVSQVSLWNVLLRVKCQVISVRKNNHHISTRIYEGFIYLRQFIGVFK